MPAQRKMFRIEQMNDVAAEAAGEMPADSSEPQFVNDAERRHHEVIGEIKLLRALITPNDEAQRVLETYQTQLAEMQKLKGELVIIHTAITRTKQEIATLHVSGFQGEQFALPQAVESMRESRKHELATTTVTIAASDPANLVGIIVPGERPAATAGRTVQFRGGHFLSEIAPAAAEILPSMLQTSFADGAPAQLSLGHD